MEFHRKKIRGHNKKVRRTWLSGGYRIVWRREAFGISLPPRFQATVRTVLPQGGEMWDFVSTRRLFKTLNAAKEACEQHFRLWSKAAEATGIRSVQELFGKVPLGFPLWVRAKLNRKVLALLTERSAGKRCDLDLEDPTRILDCSASPTEATDTAPTPASAVEEPDSLMTGPVEPATPPAKERKPCASRRTTKSLKSIAKRKPSTKRSTGSAKKPSRNSRKKKSRQSEN